MIEADGICIQDPACNNLGSQLILVSVAQSDPRFEQGDVPLSRSPLCAGGTVDDNCLIAGARVQMDVAMSIVYTATVNCRQGCEDAENRQTSETFTSVTTVTQDVYQLSALTEDPAVLSERLLESASRSILEDEVQLSALYDEAGKLFTESVLENPDRACASLQGREIFDVIISSRSIQLQPISGDFDSMCPTTSFLLMTDAERTGFVRCLCDPNASDDTNQCRAQFGEQGVCHPNHCDTGYDQETREFVQVVLDTPYVSFSDFDLQDIVSSMTTWIESNQAPSDINVMEVMSVDGKTAVRFDISNGSMLALADALDDDLISLSHTVSRVETSFERPRTLRDVTPTPGPIPTATPAPSRSAPFIPIPVTFSDSADTVIFVDESESAASSLIVTTSLVVFIVALLI